MDLDDTQFDIPVRATRVHGHTAYVSTVLNKLDVSPIPQKRPSVDKTSNHHIDVGFKIDTTPRSFQRHDLSPAQKSSPTTPLYEFSMETSMLSPNWLDSRAMLSPAPSLPSPSSASIPTSLEIDSSPSPTRANAPNNLSISPTNLVRSISSQTSSSAPKYGRSSIEKHLAEKHSVPLVPRERSTQDIPNAHMIATSIPPSSKSTPTHRLDQKRPGAQNTKQVIQVTEAEAHVQKGIRYHEGGQLEKATQHFRAAADKDSPMGMFLYGISLRHGWGCRANTQLAFQYLQRAAEHAVDDLNNLSTVSMSAAKGELVMAIYELGVSFRHGWGVQKDKKTACYYFKIAAELGDPDAQNDLAHCYYHGQGVKRDVYQAAKYYRLAAAQGQGIMGNSWIFKKKYDQK